MATEFAKKQKTDAQEASRTGAESRNISTAVPVVPKDIYSVELDGQWSDNVPVYDSCDQVSVERVRIAKHLEPFCKFF